MNRRYKVAHLTSAHPRDDVRVFLKECRALAAVGYEVSLIVADGKGNEVREGVKILDVGKSDGRMRRMIGAVNRVGRLAMEMDADVYHLHDPELLRIAGRLRRRGNGRCVVYDAHEDLPRQILSKQWIPAPARKLVSWVVEYFENSVSRKLSGIVTATPCITQRFLHINRNTIDVNNYPMPAEFEPSVSEVKRGRQVCYVGGINRIRGVEPLINALPLVPDIRLVLCGKFDDRAFEDSMRALPGWNQVDYRGQVSRRELQDVMSTCVAGLVTFLPAPNHLDAQPNKMFEYMSAELPVIASDFPLWRQIIDGAGAGLCVNPQSPNEIAKAIRLLVSDPVGASRMGKAGRAAIVGKYNWPVEAVKLAAFYERMA